MDPAMYIFLNRGLGMSTGKAAAQAGHAAVEAYRLSETHCPSLLRKWYMGGHYKKLVMQANDSTHLFTIERYLRDRDFYTALIIDEGMTEVPAHTATALGVAVVDKDSGHVNATFESFDLYREPKPEIIYYDGNWEDPGKTNDERNTSWLRSLTGFLSDTRGRNRG